MKVNILKNGSLKKVLSSKYFEIVDEYIFELFYGNVRYTITVPTGFVTDFASIPAIFFNFDKTRYISYLLHDYLYSYIGKIVIDDDNNDLLLYELGELIYDQKLADEILIAGLDYEGMNKPGRKIVFLGLCIGGRFNFKKKNKQISSMKRQIEIQKESNLIY